MFSIIMEQSEEDIILDTENVIVNDNMSNNDSDEELEDCLTIDTTDEIIKPTISDPNLRVSKNKMTKYEFVRIIGERTKQLTMGAKPLIKQSKKSELFTYSEIALEELKLNMIPFKIRRPFKDHYELWSIDELDKKHLESLFV
jgi:DNA-directed RNA polymerase subunit K/omega